MHTLAPLLLDCPASDDAFVRQPLASLDAHDAVSHTDFAFVAYKETHRTTGTWCVRINAQPVAGALFHPNAIRLQARAATALGRSWFTWGKNVAPTLHDPRKIEFRVHVRDARPAEIEIYVRLRSHDGSADEPASVTFPWPAA